MERKVFNLCKFYGILSLLLLGVSYGLSAQVSTLTNWSNAYNGTANATATVSIPTGSNSHRMLVVAIASSQTAVGARTATVTYGGQTLTLATGDMSQATTRQHTALYYLNEAGIDAATSTSLSVTFSGGTTRVNTVWTAIYDYVDQTTPLTNSQVFNSVATTTSAFAFGTPLTVNANDQAIEVISTIRNGNTTPRTITAATNWTSSNEQTFTTTDGVRNGVFTRTIPVTNTTDDSATTTSGNVLASMTAVSLKGVLNALISSYATWSNVYHNTSNLTSFVRFSTAASSKKVFVVAIATSQTAVGARTATVTYGGQTLTLATGDLADGTIRQHTALYYLDNAGLTAANSNELSVALAGGTTRVNDVWVALFDNIDQCAPISSSRNYNGGTTAVSTLAFATGLTVNPADRAIQVISSVRSGNTTPRTLTAATNWTSNNEQTFTTTDGVRNAVLSRSIPTALATDVSSTTLSGNALASMSAISLKAAQTTLTITGGGTVCTTTTLNVTNSGTGTVYFQGTTSGGTSTATPSTSEVITASGTYYFRTQSALGCWGEEASVSVVVNPAVTAAVQISSSDADNAICEGTSVTFTATPTNGGTPAYQWIKNGVDIVGASGSTYSTTTLANGDSIQVRMTSTAACVTNSPVTSSSIQTTVVTTVAPVAQNQTFCAGSTVGNLVATGTSIAWYTAATGGVALASSAVLTNSNYFATQVENGCESASRTQIAVVVNPTISSIVIVSDDADNSICSGTAVTFTATPTNGGTSPAYQWKKNGIDIPSETNAILNVSNLVNGDQITVQLTSNAVCVVTPAISNAIATTVIALPEVSAVSICAGSTASFTVTGTCNAITGLNSGARDAGTAVNATGVGTVAWGTPGNITAAGTPFATMTVAANLATNYLRSTNYGFSIPTNATIQGITVSINRSSSGTVTPFLRDNVVSLVKAGTIQSTNKAVTGTNWSNNNVLTVANYGGAADLWATTWTPAEINDVNFGVVLAATNASTNNRTATVDFIRVTVSYSIEGSLDWYTVSSGGTAIASASTFNPVGVAGSGLTNTNTSGVTPFYVACRTTGCRTQANFEIKATPNAPVGTAVSRCGTGSLQLEATAGLDEVIDWYDAAENGNLVASGTSTFTTPVLSTSTLYYAQARNSVSGCVSNSRTAIEATIVTPQTPDVSIVSSLSNTTVCAGESISFTATPMLGGLTPTYTWKVNGIAVAETSAVFNSTSLQNNDLVTVEMTSSSTACLANTVANSNQLTVVVTPLSNAGTASAAQLICAGTSTTVSISGSQGTIQWQQANPTTQLWNNVTGGLGATSATYITGNITEPVLYRALVTNGNCATGTSSEIAISLMGTYSFYVDADGDGIGSSASSIVCSTSSTNAPAGYSLTNSDCNDNDLSIWRSATLSVDADNDGYAATEEATTTICYGANMPLGYVATSLGLDCNDAVAAINPGQVEVLYNGIDDNCDGQLDEGFQSTSALQTASCGQTLNAMGSLIYANINLNATAYRFKVVNNSTGDIQYVDNTHYWFALSWLTSYDYATAYTVSVQLQIAGVWVGYYGTSCVVNSPDITSSTGSLQLVSTQCGATLPNIGTIIYTTPQSGATGYRFRITDVTPNATGSNLVQVKDRSYHWFGLTMFTRYNYGSTYMVEVAVKTTGGYTGYGSPCYIYTPASPMLNNCGAVIPTSRTLVYTAITKSVTQYRFQVTRVSDQSSRTFDTGRFWFSFKVNMPGYTPSVAYSVRVAVMTAGTWSPFGDACEITSPAIPRIDGDAELDFAANAFPNPYSDQFNLLVSTDSDELISYKVYDMLGKLIEAEELDYTALETKEFGRNYPAGVYNIIVTQGEERKTLRIIKR